MGTNCATVAFERDFMLGLCQLIEVFNSTLRYLDDLPNIDNPYFEQLVSQKYPTDLQSKRASSCGCESPFF